jgi:hypothetical protein
MPLFAGPVGVGQCQDFAGYRSGTMQGLTPDGPRQRDPGRSGQPKRIRKRTSFLVRSLNSFGA